jgi:hypothetical protein
MSVSHDLIIVITNNDLTGQSAVLEITSFNKKAKEKNFFSKNIIMTS